MTRRLAVLFAFAAGAASANLYWAQPLVHLVAIELGMPLAIAGLLVTVSQVGFVVGVVFVVPIGDIVDPRRPIVVAFGAASLTLVGAAIAPTWPILIVALTVLGLTTVGVPLLIPLASQLAPERRRGRTVGIVVSGILIGILSSRTISGVVAAALGWRAVYLLASVVAAVLALLLFRFIPQSPRDRTLSYRALLASVPSIIRHHRAVVATLAVALCLFSCFGLVWTSMTFLLSGPPFSYSVAGIGLMGLAGLGGALMAQGAGRLHDRGLSMPATGAAIALAVASVLLMAVGSSSIFALALGILLFDVAFQAALVLNQTRLFGLYPDARSRLNTALVTSNFIGASIGTAIAGVLWHYWAWNGVVAFGLLMLMIALAVWAGSRRYLSFTAQPGQ